ncbi:MAG: transglycosylase SLT domain-containing protein [Actinomycetia bacterium]|nr:transglycosylase SLT domain-containing protein [Actinomycetes bacterium]
MRPRAPLAYAGLLIVAFLAVIGFAAFSPSTDTSAEELVAELTATTVPPNGEMSARVASAVLALRVSDADSRTATTQTAPTTTSTVPDPADDTSTTVETESFTVQETATSSTQAPTTTAAPKAPKSDTTPPAIKVASPGDGDTVTQRTVTFKGTVEKGATVSSGPYAADVNDDGTWSIRLVVVDGANGATFTATDKAGNSASVRIIVYYEEKKAAPPPPATTTTAAHDEHATTTTKAPSQTTTTAGSTKPKWSPKWPADAGGQRNVEQWRSTVEKYWPANRVDCALGIIQRESKGNPRAYNSSSDALGLMQHLGKYWHARARGAGFVDGDGLVATPYNGAANIAAGAYLANYYASATGSWWNPWKSAGGVFTAQYGSCQSSNPS